MYGTRIVSKDELFALCIKGLRANKANDEAWFNEDRADRELVAYTQNTMRERLAQARIKGHAGWWRENKCSIQHLEELLQKALGNNDMISVINYAAMINARRIADK